MEMGEFNDPYSPAYQEIQPSPNDATHSLLDTLSQEVILGIAAGVVIFFISVVTVLCYWRRRQARQARLLQIIRRVLLDIVHADFFLNALLFKSLAGLARLPPAPIAQHSDH